MTVRTDPLCALPQTLSRIADWAEKTPAERERILRVLGKRNMLRLDQKKAELGIRGDAPAAGDVP